MTNIYLVEEDFFSGHLNGAQIPVFLHMVQALRAGTEVRYRQNSKFYSLRIDEQATSMDAAFNSSESYLSTGGDFALAVFQKGQPQSAISDLQVAKTALMLNDPRARQAANQLHELLSGRFGFDLYRMTAPLRYLQGLREDRADLSRFDVVYVQSETEAQFLRDQGGNAYAQVEIFKNSVITLDLFPGSVTKPSLASRPERFLLPVPPGKRREAEYGWFLGNLEKHPDLSTQITVLARKSFRRHIPSGIRWTSNVDDFQEFLTRFECVIVPTMHYTGLNNRVFQAACAGCHVIASPEALEGLLPHHPEVAKAPRDFGSFAEAMKAFPTGSLDPQTVLLA